MESQSYYELFMKDIILEHPSIVYSQEVAEICKPLNEALKIDYFCHVNVDDKGNFTALGRNPQFVEHYLTQNYYNTDVHLSNHELKEEYILQDNVTHYGETAQLFQDCSEFKLHHIFTLLQRNKNSIDAYHFACSKKNPLMNEMYLSNLDFLKHFIMHFKEKAHSNKKLKQAYDRFQFQIDYTGEGYKSNTFRLRNIKQQLENMQVDKFYLPNQKEKAYLTKRELECLLWLHFGKTAEEIALILDITTRTVRAHIINIKEKLNCHTLFQLGEKVSSLELAKLFNF